jgi:hypothetical protein
MSIQMRCSADCRRSLQIILQRLSRQNECRGSGLTVAATQIAAPVTRGSETAHTLEEASQTISQAHVSYADLYYTSALIYIYIYIVCVTNRKVAGSRPDEVNDFYQFT